MFEHHDKPHKRPKHPKHPPRGPHHGKPHHHNLTVYQLIAGSKYTTKLAKLINEYPDLVETLNGESISRTAFGELET